MQTSLTYAQGTVDYEQMLILDGAWKYQKRTLHIGKLGLHTGESAVHTGKRGKRALHIGEQN